jgi:hypothetical protein
MVATARAAENVEARSATRALVLIASSLIAALASCDGGAEQKTLSDTGSACIARNAMGIDGCSPRDIPADVPLRVDVDFATCTSSSCDTVLNTACRASRSGSVITIEAEAVIEREGNECTDDCGFVSATCELEALPAGTYELRYGDESASLTVPSTTAAGCAGAGLFGRCCDTSEDCGGSNCSNHRCQ